jgi:HEAT repeat protein
MPLIRRGPPGPEPPPPGDTPATAAAEALRHPDPERRWAAARALGDGSDPAPLAEALAAEQDPRVREALLTAMIRLGAAAALLPFLRLDDAGLRTGALEALQAMPGRMAPHLPALLADADPDVRILAAELARSLPPDQATALLCRRLETEPHPNACAAAVEVLAELGTAAAGPALRAVAERFAADPFLPFAVSAALARIGGGRD